jgi:hypothetical protein
MSIINILNNYNFSIFKLIKYLKNLYISIMTDQISYDNFNSLNQDLQKEDPGKLIN